MAKAAAPEIDKSELKRLLIRSKKEPVNCAVGLSESGDPVIKLDKIKQPRAVAKMMEDEFGDIKTPRWGTATVDVDEDPKLVILTLNKPLPGIGRKLKKTLKGTGFTKVSIRFDDGSAPEEVGEEPGESEEAPAAPNRGANDQQDPDAANAQTQGQDQAAPATSNDPGSQPAAAQAQDQAAPAGAQDQQGQAAQQPAGPDFGALTQRLTGLVRQMIPVISADPTRGNDLKALAAKCQAAIKGTDPGAAGLIDQFEQALTSGGGGGAGAPAGSAANQPAGGPQPGAAPGAAGAQPFVQDPQKHQALGQSPKLWNDTIDSISNGISQLKDAIRKDLADEPPEVLADIEKNLDRIDKVTQRFDKTLADLLKAAHEATDEAAHKASITKAKAVLAEHIKYAASEPLLAMIDQNPFGVSPDIKKTLVANLTQLASVVR